MGGSALRRQENGEELGLGAHGTCVPANNRAGPDLKGSSGIQAPGRTWVCLLELVRELCNPHTPELTHTPAPDDVLNGSVLHGMDKLCLLSCKAGAFPLILNLEEPRKSCLLYFFNNNNLRALQVYMLLSALLK